MLQYLAFLKLKNLSGVETVFTSVREMTLDVLHYSSQPYNSQTLSVNLEFFIFSYRGWPLSSRKSVSETQHWSYMATPFLWVSVIWTQFFILEQHLSTKASSQLLFLWLDTKSRVAWADVELLIPIFISPVLRLQDVSAHPVHMVFGIKTNEGFVPVRQALYQLSYNQSPRDRIYN